MSKTKKYTPVRQFYAYVGFVTMIAIIVGVVVFVIWANGFIAAGIQ